MKVFKIILKAFLALILVCSIIINVSLVMYEKYCYTSVDSFDHKYCAKMVNTKYYWSIHITATEDSVTDKSPSGMVDFAGETMYSKRFDLGLVWSEKGYDLYVLSYDIGISCIHYDEAKECWGEYNCLFADESNCIELWENGVEKPIYTISKEDVPDEVLNYDA